MNNVLLIIWIILAAIMTGLSSFAIVLALKNQRDIEQLKNN